MDQKTFEASLKAGQTVRLRWRGQICKAWVERVNRVSIAVITKEKILDELAKQKEPEKAAAPAVEPVDEAQAKLAAKLKEYKGVWVFVEQSEGIPAEVSWELLGVGAGLAKTRNVELCAIVIGDKVNNFCQDAFAYGATKAYLIDSPIFLHYRTEPYQKEPFIPSGLESFRLLS